MDTERNLKAIEALERAMIARDWKAFRDNHADSVVVYGPASPEPMKGIEDHVGEVKGLVSAFPDMRMKVDRTFGQGEWMCVEFTMTGTHKGPVAGLDGQMIPPTNRSVRLPFSAVLRFKDGKIVEERNYYDRLQMFTQLGVRLKQ